MMRKQKYIYRLREAFGLGWRMRKYIVYELVYYLENGGRGREG